MRRPFLAFAAGLLAVAAARADLAVPPPAGKKFVRIDHAITTDKAYPDYDFYVVIGSVPKKVAFGPDAPAKIDGPRRNGPLGSARFVAVPKGAAEKYDDKEFATALRTNKVPGQLAAKQFFGSQTTIDAKDPRAAVVETYAVEKLDAKDGIVLRLLKAPTPPAPGGGEKSNAPDDDPVEFCRNSGDAALAPRGGAVVAGLAAALALAFTGLWLVRRTRP